MRRLRSVLGDQSSANAVLVLAVLLLLIQTAVSSATSVAQVAAVGDGPHFVICAPLSPTGVGESKGDGEAVTDRHCPFCSVARVDPLPVRFDPIDLGPSFIPALIDRRFCATDEAPCPALLALGLAPDRTGPPGGRL